MTASRPNTGRTRILGVSLLASLSIVLAVGAVPPATASLDGTGLQGPGQQNTEQAPGTVQNLGPADSPSGAQCQAYSFPVAASESATTTFQVYGELCTRQPLTERTPLQVLLHGGTYNHTYWDWPYKPERYSYVDRATRAGFATLNIDRLGYGKSDHPNPVMLDFKVAAHVTHQVVQRARAGAIGPHFRTVVLNGHSMGGLTAQREASAYHDVDAVIVSGVGHNFRPAGIAQVADKFHPAELDPKFGPLTGWLPGYLTTLPGQRAKTFVEPGSYDPGIVPVEEANKDTLSTTELTGITLDSYDASITGQIDVPVLYALGQHDLIWCPTTGDCHTDPQPAEEHTFYDPAAAFELLVVPDSAHSINVTSSAPRFYDHTLSWLGRHGIG